MHPISIEDYSQLRKTVGIMAKLATTNDSQHSVILGTPGLGKSQILEKELPWNAQIERVLAGQLELLNPRMDLLDALDAWMEMSDNELEMQWMDRAAKWENHKRKAKAKSKNSDGDMEEDLDGAEDIFGLFWTALEEDCLYKPDMQFLRLRWQEIKLETTRRVDELKKGMRINHAWIRGSGSLRGLLEAVYLYRHMDILVFDDYDLNLGGGWLSLFNTVLANNGPRLVEHHTSREHAKKTELPKVFTVRFTAIFVCNAFGRSSRTGTALTPQQEAIHSRVQFFTFKPTPMKIWEYTKSFFTDSKVIKWIEKKFADGEVAALDIRNLVKASRIWTQFGNADQARELLESAIRPSNLEYLSDDEDAVLNYLKQRNKTFFTAGELKRDMMRFRGAVNKDRLVWTISNLDEMGFIEKCRAKTASETGGRPQGDSYRFLTIDEQRERRKAGLATPVKEVMTNRTADEAVLAKKKINEKRRAAKAVRV